MALSAVPSEGGCKSFWLVSRRGNQAESSLYANSYVEITRRGFQIGVVVRMIR